MFEFLFAAIPVLAPMIMVAIVAGAVIHRERVESRAARSLELMSGPDTPALLTPVTAAHGTGAGLSGRQLWIRPLTDSFLWLGSSPRLGSLSWPHEAVRRGQRLLVAREAVTAGRNSATFYVVVSPVSVRGAYFFNGRRTLTEALSPDVEAAAENCRRLSGARAVSIHDGLLVLRLDTLAALEPALDAAADFLAAVPGIVAGQENRGTGAAPQWEQPPRWPR